MLQREDIALLSGTLGGIALVALGHTELGIALIAAGSAGKALIPAITPGLTVQSPPVAPSVIVVEGKSYIKQADGSLKPA